MVLISKLPFEQYIVKHYILPCTAVDSSVINSRSASIEASRQYHTHAHQQLTMDSYVLVYRTP